MTFDTAVRNPERYLGILSAVKTYEGRVLNMECLLNIVSELYLSREVSSDEINITDQTTVEDIKNDVIRVNSTRNADGGFPKGYPSRFWTYMRTLSELGFVYAQYNKPFKISEIGHKLLAGELDEQEAFSIQAAKYNRRSPYRNVKNDHNFFRLAIDLLRYLQERGKKLNYEQFVVLMFNQSGELSETIEILENNAFADEQKVFKFVSEHYGNTNREATVLRDYPDVVRRLMIISGFISIRYSGKKFIEINESKAAYIAELFDIKFTLTESEKNNPEDFFVKFDSQNDAYLALIKKYRATDVLDGVEYTDKLQKIIEHYKLDETMIIQGIKKIGSQSDIVEEFKEISAPLKLEFYISILLALKYKGVFFVRPNYKADHMGKPYSHAPGNNGDINVYSKEVYWLVEVTLIRNKTQQLNSETTSVIRHLNSEEVFKGYTTKYLSLVAPVIHDDTRDYFDVSIIKNQQLGKKISIKPYDLDEFIEVTQEGKNLMDMEKHTTQILRSFATNILQK